MSAARSWHKRPTLFRIGPIPVQVTLGPLTLVAALAAVTAILLNAGVFGALLAIEPVTQTQSESLGILSLGAGIFALLTLFLPPGLAQLIALPCLGILLLIDGELLLHVTTRAGASDRTLERLRAVVASSDYVPMFIPHPFLQYTGNPKSDAYNNLGFPDRRDFAYEKTPGVIRVACVGASTTASGYPADLEGALNSGGGGARFEVMNFGLEGWNSAHVLVNVALNVLDFAPDYVVLHQGWNDNRILTGACPRRDYAGSPPLQNPEPDRRPSPSLRRLLELSILARIVVIRDQQDRLDFNPGAQDARKDGAPGPECAPVDELFAYRRNIAELVTLVEASGAQLILTTQPHSLNPNIDRAQYAPFIDKTNAHLREVAQETGLPLVDLDRAMTGVMEALFVDLGHVSAEGRREKARRIAEVILASRPAPPATAGSNP